MGHRSHFLGAVCGMRGALAQAERVPELEGSLSAAAHLIHGSSEGRSRVRWAAGGLPPEDVRSVGYDWAEVGPLLEQDAPRKLQDGFNRLADGGEIFFVSNPALAFGRFAKNSAAKRTFLALIGHLTSRN